MLKTIIRQEHLYVLHKKTTRHYFIIVVGLKHQQFCGCLGPIRVDDGIPAKASHFCF